MIDLHTHTNESDGLRSPAELVAEAAAIGLEALGITDHDTFAGYDAAAPLAKGLRLVCGIEISTLCHGRPVHLLAYFPDSGPTAAFRRWVVEGQESRRERNRKMAEKLRGFGFDIRLEDVEALGRSQTGRPHFARHMIDKGWVKSREEAFRLYLDEKAKAYVERESAQIADAIREVLAAGGIPVLAHPVRLGKLEARLPELVEQGLKGIEVWHSDHSPSDSARFLALAQQYKLRITGGSDYHGEAKSGVRLGVGRGQLSVPLSVLSNLLPEAQRPA